MSKRKLLLTGVIVVLVLAASAAAAYVVMNKKTASDERTEQAYKQNIQELIVPDEAKEFNDVLRFANENDGEQAIQLAKAYGEKTDKPATERLGSYKLCITEARKASAADSAQQCKTAGDTLAASLPDAEAREGWKKELAFAYDPSLQQYDSEASSVLAQ